MNFTLEHALILILAIAVIYYVVQHRNIEGSIIGNTYKKHKEILPLLEECTSGDDVNTTKCYDSRISKKSDKMDTQNYYEDNPFVYYCRNPKAKWEDECGVYSNRPKDWNSNEVTDRTGNYFQIYDNGYYPTRKNISILLPGASFCAYNKNAEFNTCNDAGYAYYFCDNNNISPKPKVCRIYPWLEGKDPPRYSEEQIEYANNLNNL